MTNRRNSPFIKKQTQRLSEILGQGFVYPVALGPAYFGILVNATEGSSDLIVPIQLGNLISYWSMDNVDLGSVLDVMGLNDGTNVNTLTGEPGQVDEAFLFDGYSSYIIIPADINQEFYIGPSGKMSFAAWINVTELGSQQTIISKYDSTNGERAWGFTVESTGELRILATDHTLANYTSLQSIAQITPGAWTHVGFTWEGVGSDVTSKGALYIDGYQVDGYEGISGGTFVEMSGTSSDILIGAQNPPAPVSFFSGHMDELLLFNTTVVPEEMLSIFENGLNGNRFLSSIVTPASYWTLDDADLSGTTVLDVIGSNDGTNIGIATTGVAGIVGEAFSFDGSADRIDFGDVLDQGSNSFALSAWFKSVTPGSGGNPTIINKGRNSSGVPQNAGYQLRVSGFPTQDLNFTINDGVSAVSSVIVSSGVIVNDVWIHVVAIVDRDNDSVQLYMDGRLINEHSIPESFGSVTTNVNFQIGVRSLEPNISAFLEYFDGELDELAVYSNVSLRAEDAKILYNYGLPTIPTPIFALSFDDDDTSGSTLTDKSYRGNDGTLVNSPATGVTGQVNQTYDFDGTTQYLDHGNVADLDFDTTDILSISCWFKIAAGAGQATIISKYSYLTGGSPGWQLHINPAGSIGFSFANTNFTAARYTTTTSTAFRDDTWRHVVVTYDGSDSAAGIDFYMNGVLEATTIVTNTATGSTLNSRSVFVGARDDDTGVGHFADGSLDELYVFTEELDAKQIAFIYAEGAKGRALL